MNADSNWTYFWISPPSFLSSPACILAFPHSTSQTRPTKAIVANPIVNAHTTLACIAYPDYLSISPLLPSFLSFCFCHLIFSLVIIAQAQ